MKAKSSDNLLYAVVLLLAGLVVIGGAIAYRFGVSNHQKSLVEMADDNTS